MAALAGGLLRGLSLKGSAPLTIAFSDAASADAARRFIPAGLVGQAPLDIIPIGSPASVSRQLLMVMDTTPQQMGAVVELVSATSARAAPSLVVNPSAALLAELEAVGPTEALYCFLPLQANATFLLLFCFLPLQVVEFWEFILGIMLCHTPVRRYEICLFLIALLPAAGRGAPRYRGRHHRRRLPKCTRDVVASIPGACFAFQQYT